MAATLIVICFWHTITVEHCASNVPIELANDCHCPRLRLLTKYLSPLAVNYCIIVARVGGVNIEPSFLQLGPPFH